jgi:hypothetical protein
LIDAQGDRIARQYFEKAQRHGGIVPSFCCIHYVRHRKPESISVWSRRDDKGKVTEETFLPSYVLLLGLFVVLDLYASSGMGGGTITWTVLHVHLTSYTIGVVAAILTFRKVLKDTKGTGR